ncbi:LysR family transcriptional regulator [Vineibacter terrae]|uniref:LysR family transcriptional regulator n=1 Tax=Vineibacter terrae TaxID=2586908 RepID=A0A5C8PW72_9HYPH|nr:LysR family transcriptional regulator [Vineibacter terrae]TXL82344.1 LysR family transcriptional regulator [Vineibacter terrae]
MRSLNLDQLRTLIEVIEQGSFSAAARQLNLTQPAVSLQIRELEQRFGVSLIERMGKTVHATTPGRELVEHAHRIFRECDFAASAMRRYRDGWVGRVHVGTTNTALTYQLPPILRRLRQEHPGIELLVTNMPTRDTLENIIQNRMDLGLVTLPVDDTHLRITPLRLEMLMAILPASTPDIPDVVTPEYAAQHSLVLEHGRGAVHALVMRWLAKQLPLPRTPMLMGTIEAMKKVVELDLGISIVPDVAVADPIPGVVVRPLDPPTACTLALIEHRSKPNEPALEIVRNALLELKAISDDAPAPAA